MSIAALAVMPLLSAQDDGWAEGLAHGMSGRLADLEKEAFEISAEAGGLPKVPIDNQGGSGGFASLHASAMPTESDGHSVEVRWENSQKIDEVILVPARRYDARGLEPQFGMPDGFSVVLLDEHGDATLIADETELWSDPVRAGHPFVFKLDRPVSAVGLRISAGELPPDPDEGSSYVHAWSECMVFSEGRNIARGGEVKVLAGVAPSAPWQWSAGFLVDGQTPLGLPEKEDATHVNVGWLSKARDSADSTVRLELDLGKVVDVDAIRLFPAKRPTPDLPSGFGFPEQLEIVVAARRDELDTAPGFDFSLTNPGHNPVVLPIEGKRVRFVRMAVTRLWKPFDTYPAFCALSEIEVLQGTVNHALGAGVRSADSMGNVVAPGGRYWSSQSLTDGFGPDGKIIPVPEWIGLLDRRRQLETRLVSLQDEGDAIVRRWKRLGTWAVVLTSAIGAFLLILLPIRYRIRERRKLLEVRERIAGDLHDEVGSNLGSIQMFADLAESRGGAPDELKRIQRIAAETVSAVRDIVWLLRPGGGHRIGTLEHLRETASIMLERLDWHFSADDAAWEVELTDEQNRHLFLYFREALHNILRHASAEQVWIRAGWEAGRLVLEIRDDGVGIPEEKQSRPSTLRALRQRVESLKGTFIFESGEGTGTRLHLSLPISN